MRSLGNDVVDLKEADNRASAANPRYVRRVLTEGEQSLLAGGQDPARLFWALWSAKEAAFKALKKLNLQLPFLHRQFCVEIAPASALTRKARHQAGRCEGRVKHGQHQLPVSWQWTADWMYCTTRLPGATHLVRSVADCESDSGFAALRAGTRMSECSAAARLLAQRLLAGRGLPQASVARNTIGSGLSAPFVAENGVALEGCEVSLSHDGRFAAAAVYA